MNTDTLGIVLTKAIDLGLTLTNLYILFSMRAIQNNKILVDALKEDNREMKKDIDYLSHRLRVAKIKARREKLSGL